MTHSVLTWIFALFAVSALATGCASQKSPDQGEETLPATHYFDVNLADTTVNVQLAITRAEAAQGLMDRTELGPNEGMLFLFSAPRQASFWMRNTPLPLDIGFFNAEGVLLEVYPLYPYDETSVKSNRDNISFALEMNQGWFSENNIHPGAQLDLTDIRAALRARGFDPEQFQFTHP